jgi:hypothetical protein
MSFTLDIEIRRVSYEFQRGGNEMLVIKPVTA